MANMYCNGIVALTDPSFVWASADIRVLLVTSSYTFADTHDYVSNLSNELSGGGYARVALSGKSTVLNDAGHGAYCDASDTTFVSLAAAAGDPAAAVIYIYNAADAAARLICYCPLTTPPTPTGTDYKIVWAPGGIFSIVNA